MIVVKRLIGESYDFFRFRDKVCVMRDLGLRFRITCRSCNTALMIEVQSTPGNPHLVACPKCGGEHNEFRVARYGSFIAPWTRDSGARQHYRKKIF